ncbi:MAG: hypothetical protein EPO57_09115 [Chitinophagaceae bacterium]|nr:MAG: hypothetical protein EPO57_09115 [Chitinophagaceae bacterium]
MVTLTNRKKGIEVFNLPHKEFCTEAECGCQAITTQLTEELPDGTRGVRHIERKLAGSLTLLAGESKEMPDQVLQVRDVKAAIDRGTLRVIQHQPKAPAKPQAQSTPEKTTPMTAPSGEHRMRTRRG